MIWIIGVFIIALIAWVIFSSTPSGKKFNDAVDILNEHQKYTEKDYIFCPLTEISSSDIGKFEGFALANGGNQDDKYAISLHKADGKRIGYLLYSDPKLHGNIIAGDGYIFAYIVIKLDIKGQLTGYAYIKKPRKSSNRKYSVDNDVDFEIENDSIEEEYPIRGINNYVTHDNIGIFNGYLKAETGNPYDKYAISVYNDRGCILGYLPRNDKELHSYIISLGYDLPIYGEVGIFQNEHKEMKFYGKIYLHL